MKIRLVEKFEAFDLVHVRSRNARTMVSLSLDGRRYFSLTLPGILTVSSGEHVPVAFEDEEENKIVGWIDPVSREMHSRGLPISSKIFWTGVSISTVGFIALFSVQVPPLIFTAIVFAVLFLFIFLGLKLNRFHRQLEMSLRSQS